jgi:hypothetical protein
MSINLQEIYDRLEELDPSTFETDAIKLLTGLGFGPKMMAKPTKARLLSMCSQGLTLSVGHWAIAAPMLAPSHFL